jgi:PAS domain S-box-containing protein/putative nucleotidyltransferase with HDIG domain
MAEAGIRHRLENLVWRMVMLTKLSLKDSEARYRRLFEAAQDGILVLDAGTGLIEDVNPYLVEMLGYSRAEFIKKKLWEVGAFKDIEASKEAFQALQENEYIRYDDLPLKAKDGRLVPVEFVSNVYRVGGEKVIQCNIRNNSARKEAQAAQRQSEENYRLLLETMPDGVVVHSQGRFVFLNPAAVQIYGAKNAQDLLGTPMLERVHPDYRTIVKKRITHISKGKDAGLLEEKFLRMDGSAVNVEVTAKPFIYQGSPAVQMVIRDISQRKQADEALRLSEEKYRVLVEGVNDGFYMTDAAGVFTFANPALARIYGVENPEALLGRKFTDFLASTMPAELDQAYEGAMQSGNAPKIIDGQIVRSDGTPVFIEVKPGMIMKDGQVTGTQGVVRDVTERKVAEKKIKGQLEHLTALSAIDQIISANFDLKLSLSEILAHVTKELGVDAADVLILNPNSLLLEFGAERGFRTKAIRKAQVRLGESYSGRAALERQLVQISNLKDQTDKVFLATHLAGEDFVCYYGVPLIAKGQVKGVLEIFHRSALEPDAEWLNFMNTLAGQTAIAIENSSLFESLQRSNSELGMAYDATIEGWSRALDLRDKETEGHTQRVTETTLKLARLFGLSEAELVQIRWGALLHDIGKMGVPDAILLKPGPLTEDEWVIMKKHPGFAYEMLSPIHYLRNALDIPTCHHEKWDGSGYPRGLKGNQIPLAARIFAVVDVWDALRSDRPYRPGWTKEKVDEHILSLTGTHFDPQVVDGFFSLTK